MCNTCKKKKVKKMIWDKVKEDDEIEEYRNIVDDNFINSKEDNINIYPTHDNNINNENDIVGLFNTLRNSGIEESVICNRLKEIDGVTRVSFGGNPARITSITYKDKRVKL